jgi:hypothetical protein
MTASRRTRPRRPGRRTGRARAWRASRRTAGWKVSDRCSRGQRTEEIQRRWHDLQAAFVDDPHAALRQARELNDEVVGSLASPLDERKHALEREISSGDTERLRIGLRQYHQMLDQFLAL